MLDPDDSSDQLKRYLYEPLTKISKELRDRFENHALKQEVEKYFEGTFLAPMLDGPPKIVLARHIFTPNRELHYFLDIASIFEREGWEVLLLEYPNNKFVADNLEKHHLGKIYIDEGVGKRGGHKLVSKKIIDFDRANGEMISQIETLWGQSLVDFHHELLDALIPGTTEKIHNFSDWFNLTKRETDVFYFNFLGLFVCHGVLFENFLNDKKEINFVRERVIPSYQRLEETFGHKPLVYPLLPIEVEKDILWLSYPNKAEEVLNQKDYRDTY